MEWILTNPYVAILVVGIVAIVGKYFFIPKEKETTIVQGINDLSKVEDVKINNLEAKFVKDIHDLELNIAKEFGQQSEKMRIIQKEINDEADKKFFTKEMAERHNERIAKMEEIVSAILPKLEKIDMIYDIVTKNMGE